MPRTKPATAPTARPISACMPRCPACFAWTRPTLWPAFLNETIGPDKLHQLIFFEHPPMVLDQHQQRIDSFRTERNYLTATEQKPFHGIDPERTEFVSVFFSIISPPWLSRFGNAVTGSNFRARDNQPNARTRGAETSCLSPHFQRSHPQPSNQIAKLFPPTPQPLTTTHQFPTTSPIYTNHGTRPKLPQPTNPGANLLTHREKTCVKTAHPTKQPSQIKPLTAHEPQHTRTPTCVKTRPPSAQRDTHPPPATNHHHRPPT